jgi:hypothetical protein
VAVGVGDFDLASGCRYSFAVVPQFDMFYTFHSVVTYGTRYLTIFYYFTKIFIKGEKENTRQHMIFYGMVVLGNRVLCISFGCVITSKPMQMHHTVIIISEVPVNHKQQLSSRADSRQPTRPSQSRMKVRVYYAESCR